MTLKLEFVEKIEMRESWVREQVFVGKQVDLRVYVHNIAYIIMLHEDIIDDYVLYSGTWKVGACLQ